MPMLALYPFRFRDPLTGGWIRARHRMQVPEIQRYYGDWQLIGPPEIRRITPDGVAQYNPFAATSVAVQPV
jgi:hypothetical protein